MQFMHVWYNMHKWEVIKNNSITISVTIKCKHSQIVFTYIIHVSNIILHDGYLMLELKRSSSNSTSKGVYILILYLDSFQSGNMNDLDI